MKRFLFLITFLTFSISCFAQVFRSEASITTTVDAFGDPTGVKRVYAACEGYHNTAYRDKVSSGLLILSDNGQQLYFIHNYSLYASNLYNVYMINDKGETLKVLNMCERSNLSKVVNYFGRSEYVKIEIVEITDYGTPVRGYYKLFQPKSFYNNFLKTFPGATM